MSFLRQLFRITTRRDPTVQKLARPNHKALVTAMNYEKEGEEVQTDNFFDYVIGYMTGKKIPLDVETNEPHDCPVRRDHLQQSQQQQQTQQTQRRYHPCNKDYEDEIHFDVNNKTQTGKWIPLSKDTGLPHQCQ